MRPLRFWTDEPKINGHRYPTPKEPGSPPWLQVIGLLFVCGALWLLAVLASIIAG